MKRARVHGVLRWLVLGIVMLGASLLAPAVWAQDAPDELTWEPGIRSVGSLGAAVDGAAAAAGQAGVGLMSGASLFCADLRPEATAVIGVSLAAGRRYVFVGAGDAGCEKMALEVFAPEQDDAIATDTGAPGVAAIADFTPEEDGDYTIAMTPSGNAENGFCTLILLEEDGLEFTPRQIGQACGALMRICQEVNTADLVWQDADNEWCLFGGLAAPGDEVRFTDLVLDEGRFGFAAAGALNATDLNLLLTDADDEELASDTEGDAAPIVVQDGPVDGATIAVECVSTEDDGPTFVVCCTVVVR